MAQVSMKALDQKHWSKLLEKQYIDPLYSDESKMKTCTKNHSCHVAKSLNWKNKKVKGINY